MNRNAVASGLELLADGLRPYVIARIEAHQKFLDVRDEIGLWDAQALLVFMWDHWNDLFRQDLSFLERSLVSELREFRNRWAHQDKLDDHDTYRVIDDVERLLKAASSPLASAASQLRQDCLRRLWNNETANVSDQSRLRRMWPWILCGASAVALDTAIIAFGPFPWTWILSALLFLAMMRLASQQAARERRLAHGPRECSGCGRIVYSVSCPYCVPPDVPNLSTESLRSRNADRPPNPLVTGSWRGIQPGRHYNSDSHSGFPGGRRH